MSSYLADSLALFYQHYEVHHIIEFRGLLQDISRHRGMLSER